MVFINSLKRSCSQWIKYNRLLYIWAFSNNYISIHTITSVLFMAGEEGQVPHKQFCKTKGKSSKWSSLWAWVTKCCSNHTHYHSVHDCNVCVLLIVVSDSCCYIQLESISKYIHVKCQWNADQGVTHKGSGVKRVCGLYFEMWTNPTYMYW